MASVGQSRASQFATKKETTTGVYAPPTVGSDFLPLRPGNELNYEPEITENDELLNDIGAAKSINTGDAVSGSHSAYLRHSGVEGQEPQLSEVWESLFGSKYVVAVEQVAAASSTTTLVKVADGTQFRVGQALLVKKSNGYKIVNIDSITGNDLTLNFALDSAPVAGNKLGLAVCYIPTGSDHPSFSTTKYLGNGYAIEASAGNITTEAAITMDAKGLGSVEFSFEGTKYFYNPITITATSKFLDVTDDTGTFAVSVAEKTYNTPVELAETLNAALSAASTETYTVSFSSTTGKFTIASGSTVLSLLWSTGTNSANSIGAKLGFVTTSNDTGAVTYSSDNAQVYSNSITPSYDSSDAIIIKGAELFIGNQSDNLCICAQSISITVSKEVENVDCICEESGTLEKMPVSRTASMEITATLKKHDVSLLDALLKNKSVSAMVNCGPKTGGNWVGGKCFNAYMQSATVGAYTTTGDSFLQVSITLNGFVSATKKDIYFNFI